MIVDLQSLKIRLKLSVYNYYFCFIDTDTQYSRNVLEILSVCHTKGYLSRMTEHHYRFLGFKMLEHKHIFLFLIQLLYVYGLKETFINEDILHRISLLENKVAVLEIKNTHLTERMAACEDECIKPKTFLSSLHTTDQRLVQFIMHCCNRFNNQS